MKRRPSARLRRSVRVMCSRCATDTPGVAGTATDFDVTAPSPLLAGGRGEPDGAGTGVDPGSVPSSTPDRDRTETLELRLDAVLDRLQRVGRRLLGEVDRLPGGGQLVPVFGADRQRRPVF